MNPKDAARLAVDLVIIAIFSIFLYVCYNDGLKEGRKVEKEEFQKEAIIQGHAEYRIDENGNAVWNWKKL
jgi:hypothetical protein